MTMADIDFENECDQMRENSLPESDSHHAQLHAQLSTHVFSADEGPEDILWDLFCDKRTNTVNIDAFIFELHKTGIRDDDPRLSETLSVLKNFKKSNRTHFIPEVNFKEAVKSNITMLSRAFSSEFRINDFDDFSSKMESIYEQIKSLTGGKNADYIPQLAKLNPNYWGVSICTVDGQRVSFGDCNVPFSIQSSSKPIMYSVAATDLGAEQVHRYVGTEPSGLSFNEITLDNKNRPHNPMINAGAILIASLIKPECSPADRFDYIMKRLKSLAGNTGHVGFNNSVFLSEKHTAWRNFALAYFMREKNCFPENSSLEDALDLYFQICSIEVDAETLAVIAGTLAKGGVCPITEERLLEPEVVRNTLSIMFSCGMYDYSGQFGFKVGLPAKSSVSGAVLLVIPNVCGIVTFSPPLDELGNSVKGVAFCEEVVKVFPFHNFQSLNYSNDRQTAVQDVVTVLFAAQKGDISAFRRFSLQGIDLNQKDYDSRTALHIAACEGHLELVIFLVDRCKVDFRVKDRWGNTPASEALQFGHTAIHEYLTRILEIGSSRKASRTNIERIK